MSVMFKFASDASKIIGDGAKQACGNSCGNSDLTNIFKGLSNTLIFIVGALSVIMIIIGGLRYVISNGDSKAVGDAKNTILYAVVGLIVSIAAYSIVNFVVKSL